MGTGTSGSCPVTSSQSQTDRNKPGVAFWATVVVVALAAYPLTFGPACWITSRTNVGVPVVNFVYLPMMWLYDISPKPVRRSIMWYSRTGAPYGWSWTGADTWADVGAAADLPTE